MSVIFIPQDKDNSAFSFMAWSRITNPNSLQYELKQNYINTGYSIYDPDGLADIYGKKVIATTSTIGDVGDEVDIVFRDNLYGWRAGRILNAIIGDIKNQNDTNPPCDRYGHTYGRQRDVVEFLVNGKVFVGDKRIYNTIPCLVHNPVIKIINYGQDFVEEKDLL